MDLLKFISDIVGHLAWPVTVLLLAILFRVSLAKLLLRLTRLKGKGWELEFGKELEELKEAAAEAELSPPRETKSLSPGAPRIVRGSSPGESEKKLEEARTLATVAPSAGIALAWEAIEIELLNAVKRVGELALPASSSPIVNAMKLTATGVITAKWVKIIEKMYDLRNSIVHNRDSEVSAEHLKRYADLAEQVILQIERGIADKEASGQQSE